MSIENKTKETPERPLKSTMLSTYNAEKTYYHPDPEEWEFICFCITDRKNTFVDMVGCLTDGSFVHQCGVVSYLWTFGNRKHITNAAIALITSDSVFTQDEVKDVISNVISENKHDPYPQFHTCNFVICKKTILNAIHTINGTSI